jgi:hypothetical protein
MHLNTEPIPLEPSEELLEHLKLLMLGKYKGKYNPSYRANVIIETGTYLGTGSTMMICKLIRSIMTGGSSAAKAFDKILPEVFTIEASESNYNQARINLDRFRFCKVIHGCSVDVKDAIEFIKSDEAIINHEKYPQFIIDTLDDPVGFYTSEVAGQLFGKGKKGKNFVLRTLIAENMNKRPIFILDSAGGIGWMEFQYVVNTMGRRRYAVLLDDVQHLKHFRSYLYAKKCNWELLCEQPGRWALFLHQGQSGNPDWA